MTVKLKTPSNGSVSLTPQDTASDVVVTVPSTAGSLVTANSSGNVGIGTSSPAVRLDLGSGANVSGFKMTDQWQDIVTSSYSVGTRYNYGSGTYYGRLYVNATGFNLDTGTSAVNMVFGTNNTERMRIDSIGRIIVASTAAQTAYFSIPVSGSTDGISTLADSTSTKTSIIFRNPNGVVGTINTSGTATTYATSSDYRLKENIQPMQNALGVVAQLNPVTYTWKADGSDGQGFIAHELQEVMPDCVTGEKDAVDAEGNPVYQGVDTSFLVATLTAAIQEQQAIINSLQDRITALENA